MRFESWRMEHVLKWDRMVKHQGITCASQLWSPSSKLYSARA